MRWLLTLLTPNKIQEVFGLSLLLIGLVLANTGAAEPNKRAVIFIGPDVTYYQSLSQHYRIEYEIMLYNEFGYKVEIKKATVDEIVGMIIEDNVERISFFGHGNGVDDPSATSTFMSLSATHWRSLVRLELYAKYQAEGLSSTVALDRATAETQNFGFEGMRNHSCSSLVDTSLADLFVMPGGTYSGVTGLYAACPTPYMILSDVSFFLDDYVRPLPTGPAVDLTGVKAMCDRLGPADGCLPGSANCVPCPGDNPTAWYDITRWPIQPVE